MNYIIDIYFREEFRLTLRLTFLYSLNNIRYSNILLIIYI